MTEFEIYLIPLEIAYILLIILFICWIICGLFLLYHIFQYFTLKRFMRNSIKENCNVDECNTSYKCIYCKYNEKPICKEHNRKMKWSGSFWYCKELIHIKSGCRM